MPASVIKSFAKKSGKSEAEVERIWKGVKKSVMDDGTSENSPKFYEYAVGRLKNALKIEGMEEIEASLYSSFLREKEDKAMDKVKMKADVPDNDKSDDDKAQDDEDDDQAVLDGDYNAPEMLRAVIETIRYVDDPEGEAGEEGELTFGLEIMYEIADQVPEDTAEIIIDALFQYYDIDDEDVEDNLDADDDDDDAGHDEELHEMMQLMDLPEAMSAVKKKRLYFLKKKRKKQLGKRAGSMQFKRSYKFDTKSGRYKKRKKPQSVSQMRKKARRMARQNKKGGTKARQAKSKRRVKHVKDPYGGRKKK